MTQSGQPGRPGHPVGLVAPSVCPFRPGDRPSPVDRSGRPGRPVSSSGPVGPVTRSPGQWESTRPVDQVRSARSGRPGRPVVRSARAPGRPVSGNRPARLTGSGRPGPVGPVARSGQSGQPVGQVGGSVRPVSSSVRPFRFVRSLGRSGWPVRFLFPA